VAKPSRPLGKDEPPIFQTALMRCLGRRGKQTHMKAFAVPEGNVTITLPETVAKPLGFDG